MVAQDIYQKFTRLGRTVFTTLDHHLFASMLGSTEKPSVFIVISNSGTNKEASTLADLAKQQGIPIVSITQDEKSVIGEKVISSSKPLVGRRAIEKCGYCFLGGTIVCSRCFIFAYAAKTIRKP